MSPRARLRLGLLCVVLGACSPPAGSPRTFIAGPSCPLTGAVFGAVPLGSDVVLSLFELDALQQLQLSDCSQQKRWDTAPGPRALISLGPGFASASSNALNFSPLNGGATSLSTTPGPSSLLATDLDADGNPELVATLGATAAEAKVVVLRLTQGTLGVIQELPLTASAALASVDLDGDSDLDVLVARTNENRLTVLENVAGSLVAGADIPVCDEPFALTPVQTPGALPMLVVTCRTGGLELLRQVNGAWTHQKLPRAGTLYETVVADFDRDGWLDFASVDPFAHRLVLWWGKSSGQFDPPAEFPTPRGPILLRAFNFDRDARPDLLVLAFQDRSVTVFRLKEELR